MTPEQVGDLLALAAAYDDREVGEAQVVAWLAATQDIDFEDAKSAVVAHYQDSRYKVMPADVRKRVRAMYATGMPHSRACRENRCRECAYRWCNCTCHGFAAISPSRPRTAIEGRAPELDQRIRAIADAKDVNKVIDAS